MVINKRSVIVVTATTGIGLASTYINYALRVPTVRGEKFTFVKPTKLEFFYVLATGIAAGFLIDFIMKKIEDSVKPKEEKLLDDLYNNEKEKIAEGVIVNKSPTIVWI